MALYRQTVEDYGLYPGLELTQQQLEALRRDAGAMSAKMRAVRIVAASSVSERDLQERLVRKGEDPEQAKDAVQWMHQLNLLDDARTAAQIVARCASRGYGLARAKQALYEKKIPRELWDGALADYPDQTDVIVAFLRKRLDGGEAARRRACDALARRGFRWEEIRRGLEQLDALPEAEPET